MMKTRALRIVWILILSHASVVWSQVDPLPALRAQLTNHIAQPQFAAAQWGIKVVEVESGDVWFEHQPGKLIKPASNAKLFTGALALDTFKPNHRIATSFYASGKPNSLGELAGDLIVFGRGDPSFSARFRQGDYEGLLDPLADAVVLAGIRRVTGDLVGDERYFRGAPYGMNWTWDDLQYYYGAEVSPLTIQDNVVDLILKPGERVGLPCVIETMPTLTTLEIVNRTRTSESNGVRSIEVQRPLGGNIVYISGSIPLQGRNYVTASTVHRPALWFLELLRAALQSRGVEIAGELKAVNWLDRYPVDYTQLINLGNVHSRPMSELVERMMKPSQNLYAQLLLLQAGAVSDRAGDLDKTTEQLGLDVMKSFLRTAGIPRREVYLEEGSGLSRGALVTPNAVVALLRHMWTHPRREAFLNSLPTSGKNGTMESRLRQPSVLKKVRAKTGTLSHVSALSGYLSLPTEKTLAFSIMLNQYSGGHTSARESVDQVVVMLAESALSPAVTEDGELTKEPEIKPDLEPEPKESLPPILELKDEVNEP